MSRVRRVTSWATLVVILVVWTGASACQAQQSNREKHKISESRVLYADSILAPMRPTQALQISVSASSTYDPNTTYWTYTYSVTNDASSTNVLERFALTPMWTPVSVESPPHWIGFFGSDGDSAAVVWSVKDVGPPPANWSGLDSYIGPYHVGPGQTLAGFKIVSRQPPAAMPFYATGFDTLPGGGEEGRESPPAIFEEGITGSTIGPDNSSVTGVDPQKVRQVSEVELRAPLPNPSSGNVTIAFTLPQGGRTRLVVYDVAGRGVKTLTDKYLPAGIHSVSWNGTSNGKPVAAGLYFYELTVDGRKAGQKKTILIR